MVLTELAIVSVVNDSQYLNASSPIEVTELGIVIVLNDLQLSNARLPISLKN